MVRLLASRLCSVLGAVAGTEDGGDKTGLFWEGCSGIRGVDCSRGSGSGMFWELGEGMIWELGEGMIWEFGLFREDSRSSADGRSSAFVAFMISSVCSFFCCSYSESCCS